MNKLLLTGGAGNIGQAIAKKFINNGVEVLLPDIEEMDLLSMESIDSYMQDKVQDISIFIHCAGINFPKPIENILFEDLYKTMQINAFSFFRIVQLLSENFQRRKNGHILGISSIYGSFARKGRLSYSASKHCLSGMVKTLALEFGAYNVKCNTLSPGFVDTEMTRRNNDDKTIKSFENKVPLGRLAQVENIADVAYFLCSEQNKYINGQDIVADGGYTIGGFQE